MDRVEPLITDAFRSVPFGEGAHALYMIVDGKGYDYTTEVISDAGNAAKAIAQAAKEESHLAAGTVLLVVVSGDGKVVKNTTGKVDDVLERIVRTKGETYSLALGLLQHLGHEANRTGLLLRFADKVDDTNVRNYWQLFTSISTECSINL